MIRYSVSDALRSFYSAAILDTWRNNFVNSEFATIL